MNTVRQLNYDGPSQYSKWLRDSNNHDMDPRCDNLRVYDIDWIIWKKEDFDFGDGPFMIVEEKCFDNLMEHDQAFMYYKLDKILKLNIYWKGFHSLRFGKQTPDDGSIHLDERYISKADLIRFWKFGQPDEWYVSWFDKLKAKNIPWRQLTKAG